MAARLWDSENALWLILHHEPPGEMGPKGTIATHWLGLRMHEYHPTLSHADIFTKPLTSRSE
jgi:hypothetical protein